MSRFFSQSRKPVRRPSSQDAKDVQESVSRLERSVETQRSASDEFNETHLRPVLAPMEEVSKDDPSIVRERVREYRQFSLPRDQQKSLLNSQYNINLQHAVEAYRNLRTKLVKHQDQTGVRSIVFSSASQGEGKTLTAFNLALCFARIQNCPVLLVDADLRTQGMSRLLGDPHSAGLAQILESGCSYDSAILQTDVPNLYVLPAGESRLPAPELFARAGLKEFIHWSTRAFNLVLIDAPPMLHLADFELIEAACEGVVLIVRLGITSRESLGRICASVDRQKLLGLVLNSSRESAGSAYYKYLSKSELK